MMLATAWVMSLATLRDRAALVLVFALPPLVFVVFAAIFSGASGEELRLRVGIADEVGSVATQRFVDALVREPSLRLRRVEPANADAVRSGVRTGRDDVGLVIQAELAAVAGDGPAPILLVDDPGRGLATSIVIGQVQKTLNERLPDVALSRVLADVESSGAIGREQRTSLEGAFRERAGGTGAASPAALFATDGAGPAQRPPNIAVGYYAGAVVAVFLLFAALQGAASLIDEREAGLVDRLHLSARAAAALIAGKFLYLVAQGFVQATLVFVTAVVLFGVALPVAALGPWLITATLAAATAASLALAITAACRTRRQAETLATFGVLLVSAAGGSMVPRYLMPSWLQDLGWATPNAWIIEAFQDILRPGAAQGDALGAWAVLGGITVVAGAVAAVLTLRFAVTSAQARA